MVIMVGVMVTVVAVMVVLVHMEVYVSDLHLVGTRSSS